MGGEDHVVEKLPFAAMGAHLDAPHAAAHALHRRAGAELDALPLQSGLEPPDIFALIRPRTVYHWCWPVWCSSAWFSKNRISACAGKSRIFSVGVDQIAPGKRQQVVIAEPGPGAERVEEIAEGLRRVRRRVERARVEAEDVAQHAQEARIDRVLRLREDRPRTRQTVFQRPAAQARAETHVDFATGTSRRSKRSPEAGNWHS